MAVEWSTDIIRLVSGLNTYAWPVGGHLLRQVPVYGASYHNIPLQYPIHKTHSLRSTSYSR